jgi:hypothetical protein
MTIEPESRLIYVIAGRRHDTFLGDMYTFHCDTLQVKEVNSGQVGSVDFCVMGARATKDQKQGKIYLYVWSHLCAPRLITYLGRPG